jgi:hypothetical membrane protein
MTGKTYAVFGISAMILFWTTYIIMSNLRPEFNLFHKAISELGSLDAPDKWVWNILGYVLPGVLIVVFSYGLFKNISDGHGSKLPLTGFVLSGLFMSLSGLFPGDFEDRQSTTMLLHTIGSFGSYIFFLLGAFTYPKQMKESAYWKATVKPTLIFTWITIVFGAWPFIFKSYPSVGQRIVFFFYFMWIFYMALQLYRRPPE